jgi:hypothetical protein
MANFTSEWAALNRESRALASTPEVGPDVHVVGCPPQKARRFERVEDRVGTSLIEIPKSLRLPFRQVKSWHLSELRLNQTNTLAEVLS